MTSSSAPPRFVRPPALGSGPSGRRLLGAMVLLVGVGLVAACDSDETRAGIAGSEDGGGGGGGGGGEMPADVLPPYETPACDAPLGGLDLGGRPEGQGDFALDLAELAQLSVEARARTYETADLAPFIREVVAYLLHVPPASLGTLTIDELIGGTPLAQGVALAFLRGDGRRPQVDTLRRALHRYYACEQRLPLWLDDMRAIAGPLDPEHDIEIEVSRPKAHPRHLRANLEGTVYFAETRVEGVVRETEVLWAGHREDGALEFMVYGEDGRLQDASHFVTSEGPETPEAMPYACMACHRDRFHGTGFTTVLP